MFTGKMRKGHDSYAFRPMRELDDIRRRIDEDLVRPVLHAVYERIPEEAKSWSPAADVFEKGDNLMIKVQLPGMKQADIDLSVTTDSLTVKGIREPESGIKPEDYFQNEIAYGSVYRTIDLPFSVNTGNIEAVYEEGVLIVTLQRTAGSKPKKVSVQIKKGSP